MNKKLLITISSILAVIVISFILAIIFFNKKEPITHNVSFETNGGTKISTQIVNEGEVVVKPRDPMKEGYVFLQWTYQGKAYDFSLPVQSDLVLIAKWEEKIKDVETFVVKFNSDGGTTIPNQQIEKGNKVTKPTDPIKEGYIFKGWLLNNETYDFNKIVESDLELVASWEKVEQSNNNQNPSENNNNNNNTENPKNEPKLTTPTITKAGFGVGPAGAGIDIKIEPVGEITGVEVYASTSSEGKYTKLKTVLVNDLIDGDKVSVMLQHGQHLYYKVRTYVKNSAGTFYSGYSNIVDLDYSLTTPTITKAGFGVGPAGAGIDIKIKPVGEITGVEVYASTTSNGTYEKLKTVLVNDLIDGDKVSVMLQHGQHLYYKVRTYVKNSAGTFYSGYSNIVDLDYSLTTPTITKTGFGVGPAGAGIDIKIEPVGEITGVEVYASTTSNGTYEKLKTVLVNDLIDGDKVSVMLQHGQHLYYKVRTYVKNSAGTFYSGYSNIVDLDYSLPTPTIIRNYGGSGVDGSIGIGLELDLVGEITGVEVYASTTSNGTYEKLKTVLVNDLENGKQVSVIAKQGEHFFYKVRTYVKNSAGTFYSEYSNVIELDNSN